MRHISSSGERPSAHLLPSSFNPALPLPLPPSLTPPSPVQEHPSECDANVSELAVANAHLNGAGAHDGSERELEGLRGLGSVEERGRGVDVPGVPGATVGLHNSEGRQRGGGEAGSRGLDE